MGARGALLHALFTTGYIFPFSMGAGCSCLCPPPTNAEAWFATILVLLHSMAAAVLAATSFASERPSSLEKHWASATAASTGFLISGGALLRASMMLTEHVLPQAVVLVFGAVLLTLATTVALIGRARVGAVLGAVGAYAVGLSGLFPIISGLGLIDAQASWDNLVSAALQASLIGHPFVMLAVAGVLTILAAGVHKRVVVAAAVPLAKLAVLSFISLANLSAHIFSLNGVMPELLRSSVMVFVLLAFLGPGFLGIAASIATAVIVITVTVRGSNHA